MGKSSKERNSEGPGDFTLPAVGKTLSTPEVSGTKTLRRDTPVRVKLGVALVEMMMTPPRKKNTTRRRRERQEEGRGSILSPFFLDVSAQPHLGMAMTRTKGVAISLSACAFTILWREARLRWLHNVIKNVRRADIVEVHLGSTQFSRRRVFSVKRVEIYPASHHPTLTEPRRT